MCLTENAFFKTAPPGKTFAKSRSFFKRAACAPRKKSQSFDLFSKKHNHKYNYFHFHFHIHSLSMTEREMPHPPNNDNDNENVNAAGPEAQPASYAGIPQLMLKNRDLMRRTSMGMLVDYAISHQNFHGLRNLSKLGEYCIEQVLEKVLGLMVPGAFVNWRPNKGKPRILHVCHPPLDQLMPAECRRVLLCSRDDDTVAALWAPQLMDGLHFVRSPPSPSPLHAGFSVSEKNRLFSAFKQYNRLPNLVALPPGHIDLQCECPRSAVWVVVGADEFGVTLRDPYRTSIFRRPDFGCDIQCHDTIYLTFAVLEKCMCMYFDDSTDAPPIVKQHADGSVADARSEANGVPWIQSYEEASALLWNVTLQPGALVPSPLIGDCPTDTDTDPDPDANPVSDTTPIPDPAPPIAHFPLDIPDVEAGEESAGTEIAVCFGHCLPPPGKKEQRRIAELMLADAWCDLVVTDCDGMGRGNAGANAHFFTRSRTPPLPDETCDPAVAMDDIADGQDMADCDDSSSSSAASDTEMSGDDLIYALSTMPPQSIITYAHRKVGGAIVPELRLCVNGGLQVAASRQMMECIEEDINVLAWTPSFRARIHPGDRANAVREATLRAMNYDVDGDSLAVTIMDPESVIASPPHSTPSARTTSDTLAADDHLGRPEGFRYLVWFGDMVKVGTRKYNIVAIFYITAYFKKFDLWKAQLLEVHELRGAAEAIAAVDERAYLEKTRHMWSLPQRLRNSMQRGARGQKKSPDANDEATVEEEEEEDEEDLIDLGLYRNMDSYAASSAAAAGTSSTAGSGAAPRKLTDLVGEMCNPAIGNGGFSFLISPYAAEPYTVDDPCPYTALRTYADMRRHIGAPKAMRNGECIARPIFRT